VRAVHVESLHEGWLGKVNALEQGRRRASGDWLLFTDADVYFAPGALRRGMAYAIRHDLDHLTVVPETTDFAGFQLDVSIRTFSMMLCASARIAEVNREGSSAFIGIGPAGSTSAVSARSLNTTAGLFACIEKASI
jgi:glycosyltransferase involved in cell wall biosynthesis